MREVVAPQVAEVYPQFAAKVFGVGRGGFRAVKLALHASRSPRGDEVSELAIALTRFHTSVTSGYCPLAPPAGGAKQYKREGKRPVKTVEAAVIGVGWGGGTRAETLSRTALVDKLHLCEIQPDRLAEVKELYKPATATLDYQDIIKNPNISVVYISTTPETNHYPICRDCLKAGKNVMLEKPIALELWEADELIELAKRNNLKFTIGYSQRFNTKIAYAKKKITDGTLGKVVSVLVSRHLSRSLGKKIAGRVRLSPVVMESTHDLDFVFWLLEPAKPVRVY